MRKTILFSVLIIMVLAVIAGYSHLLPTPGPKLSYAGSSSDRPIFRVPAKEKVVALSFDDGPDPAFTVPILKILRQKGARATFFVVGANASKHPDIIRDMALQGDEVANHTWTHPEMDTITTGQLISQVKATNELISRLTGKENHFFRPPKGVLNARDRLYLSKAGYTTIMWSICIENRKAGTPRLMAQRVLNNISPGEIILLHDGRLDRTKTVRALPLLLDGLKNKGYSIVTVGNLIKDKSI